ncbi:thioredoxin family protein [Bacillus sp. AFS041924]|uniref:thioredoxin family protein n=1 Tax=Bacillus sp. AFS041924 TaxID=2033503 RepID=UPI000BFB28DD|nr:thioredoxin family protein [Bacillus sp. AFS041924]PGS47937.1 thiol reductase thioredoxin [Bacillus sp. AFS041924]
MEKIVDVKKYEEVIKSEKPIVVKFYATWCPDCTRLDAFIPDVIEEHPSFTWYTMDRDEFPEIASEQQVMGIPSLLVYKNGEKIGHLHSANAKTPESVEEFLSTFE